MRLVLFDFDNTLVSRGTVLASVDVLRRATEFGQRMARITVINDVRFVGCRGMESGGESKKVLLAELDRVCVHQRHLIALPDAAPAHLMRHGQIDEYGYATSVRNSVRPLRTLPWSPESMVDHGVVASQHLVPKLCSDVLKNRFLPDAELATGEVATVVTVAAKHLFVRAEPSKASPFEGAGESRFASSRHACHENRTWCGPWLASQGSGDARDL